MPDWSYQTLFRPLLFRLEAERARDLTLGTIGALARLPLGPQLIELLGHMRPSERQAVTVAGIRFPTPVGLDAGLDPRLLGIEPLSQFGFGYMELGPVTESGGHGPSVRRLAETESLWCPDIPANAGLRFLVQALQRRSSRVPLGIRLGHAPGAAPGGAAAERRRLMAALAGKAAFFTLETQPSKWGPAEWEIHLSGVLPGAPRPTFLCLSPDLVPEKVECLVTTGLRHGMAGVVITRGVTAPWGGRIEGPGEREPALALLRHLRDRLGPGLPMIAGGGIHTPADALAFRAAGATLVHVRSGLVYSGPGLPKRINEAFAHQDQTAEDALLAPAERRAQSQARGRGWAGAALMAWGIFVGAAVATWIALTRVVLPYDEAFVGLTRAQLEAINPRLLPFMEHDRISLSGTMAASAVLYLFLAWYPWRAGEHWARPAFLFPATVGFLTYFLWPGYGYLEPLHTLFYLVLLPFFLYALLKGQRGEPAAMPASLVNDRAWRLAQWGQLLWIVLAAGGTVAGLTIMAIGVTSVFVPEDLAFMQTNAEALRAVPRLVPLIAHDRFGFGTALTCNGITVLLMSLWGFRRGARWLWWSYAVAGVPSYVAAFGTHIAVGYTDLWHLTPPLAGLVILLAALACSYPYLTAKS